MKIIKPGAEYLDPNAVTAEQFIERVGRTCYKSEDKITPDSAVAFVKQMVQRGHWAMLEHAYVYLRLTPRVPYILDKMPESSKRFLHISGIYMSANMRAMQEWLFEAINCPRLSEQERDIVIAMMHEMQLKHPAIFGESDVSETYAADMSMNREEFIKELEETNNLAALRECVPHTILFHVDRGVTHELVRHRPASFAQESTRYCNYSRGKYGNEITVVEPFWAEDPEKSARLYVPWEDGCRSAEASYMAMLEAGAVAQEARAVLPTSVKNDIVVTATEAEWEHILNLRAYGTTGAPHPDMRRVMLMAAPLLRQQSHERLYKTDYTD